MNGFVNDIDQMTAKNKNYRRVVYTGKHLQLVVMALKPGDEIGDEVHKGRDQFFRIEKGHGTVVIDGEKHPISKKTSIVVPAGARHNVINTGEKTLKLYTLYGPPNHREGVVFQSKAEAEASTEKYDGRTTEGNRSGSARD